MNKKLHCILLIDDDEANNFLSNVIIEEANCAVHVKTTQTAKSALNYLAEAAELNGHHNTLPFPELIFLDINMPAMDGWEFMEEYNAIKSKFQQMPVIIMLTTSINPDDRAKARNLPQITEFYNKPMTPEMITEIVTTYFP